MVTRVGLGDRLPQLWEGAEVRYKPHDRYHNDLNRALHEWFQEFGTAINNIITTGIAGITTKDEGVTVGTAAGVTTLDFVGAGVTATGAGATATITIPGGSGVTDASFLVLGLHAGLSAERVATAETNISFVDTGANGTLTISAKDVSGNGTLTTLGLIMAIHHGWAYP